MKQVRNDNIQKMIDFLLSFLLLIILSSVFGIAYSLNQDLRQIILLFFLTQITMNTVPYKLYNNPETQQEEDLYSQEFSDELYLARKNLKLNAQIDKPKLHLRTQYNTSFRPKRYTVRPQAIPVQKQRQQKTSQLDQSYRSEYRTNYKKNEKSFHDFKGNLDDSRQLNNKNNPFFGLTTYKSVFANFRGSNQYVPMVYSKVKNPIKINSNTTYTKNFSCQNHNNMSVDNKNEVLAEKKKTLVKNIEEQMNKRLCNSEYRLNYSQNKGNKNNQKHHDYSTLLLFQTPLKGGRILDAKTTYTQGFTGKVAGSDAFDKQPQHQSDKKPMRICSKGKNLQIYRKKQADLLKLRIKTMI